MSPAIPRAHKYLFWLNLGLISTFFAEIISGSDLFPYFHFWGVFSVVPLYLLHTLLLVTLVFRAGRPALPALYFAGTIFGLYEAYITKILWNPSWGDEIIKIGEVAVFEVLVLVFFWHVWMSFILPLLAAETWLTRSTEIRSRLPLRMQRFFMGRRGWLVLAIFGGLFVSINAASAPQALLSALGAVLVLGFFGWLWQRLTREKSYTMEDLLPTRRELVFLLISIAGLYLFTGIFLRPQAYPPLVGHFTIWVLYGLCALFLTLALKASRIPYVEAIAIPAAPLRVRFLWLGGIFLYALTAIIAETLLLPLAGLIGLAGWFGAALLGLFCLAWSLRSLFLMRGYQAFNY